VRFLAAVAAWLETDLHWAVPPRPVDFYDIKGCVEDLLEGLRIPEPRFVRAADVPYFIRVRQPGSCSAERRSVSWGGSSQGDGTVCVPGQGGIHLLKSTSSFS